MKPTFRLIALPAETFAPLFQKTDEELGLIGARRVVVDEKPGYPCRVSLTDAELGETVVALSFTHHDVDSPYRSSGPIFVRKGVPTVTLADGEIPLMFQHRLLSLRGYDRHARMIAADVVQGQELSKSIEQMLGNPEVQYLHVHNARPGWFNCTVFRTESVR